MMKSFGRYFTKRGLYAHFSENFVYLCNEIELYNNSKQRT